jgi:hypothetical protein
VTPFSFGEKRSAPPSVSPIPIGTTSSLARVLAANGVSATIRFGGAAWAGAEIASATSNAASRLAPRTGSCRSVRFIS